MATSNAASARPPSVPVPAASPRVWDHSTESVVVNDRNIGFYVLAVGDDQKVHLSDEEAQKLPFNLKGRIVHGALTRDIAVNYLIQRCLAKLLGITETHAALDQGGKYRAFAAVYPGEAIYVRCNFEGRARPRGSFPLKIEYAVFVQRECEVLVMEGCQEALMIYYKDKLKEVSKP